MDREKLDAAIALAAKVRHIIVATTDTEGMPHIAVAGRLEMAETMAAVSAWYCPMTLINIETHPRVALAVWDIPTDTGYQLLGRFDHMRDLAVMDAYAPKIENRSLYIQTERQLIIRVEKVLFFSQALHADTEE
jgi:hypothetical protein